MWIWLSPVISVIDILDMISSVKKNICAKYEFNLTIGVEGGHEKTTDALIHWAQLEYRWPLSLWNDSVLIIVVSFVAYECLC